MSCCCSWERSEVDTFVWEQKLNSSILMFINGQLEKVKIDWKYVISEKVKEQDLEKKLKEEGQEE